MKLKTIGVIAGIVLVFGLLAFGSLYALVTGIKGQRDCEWANIDNVEFYAHVNIPHIHDSNCNFDPQTNTKYAYFSVDKDKVDPEEYILVNKLEKVDPSSISTADFLDHNKDGLLAGDLYQKNCDEHESTAKVLFDKNSGGLWVTINYAE